ncbi:MAG: PepSY-associated TM helix domain-containing protein [Bacteroidota bacterium]
MKKLRGLGNKNYNVLFHTHTVAGIAISFALFVIFYAGAFSLFRDQVDQWENPDLRQPVVENFDLDKALALVDSTYEGLNYHKNTNITFPHEGSPFMYVYGAVNNTDSTTERMAAYINPTTLEVQNVRDPKTTVNDTIYVLHYFGQIPVIGLYLSGLVALFFLFAIVSGILIHWQNLLTKFYSIIKEGKWKTIWTNAHTVLGVIGIPFQVLYAVTGAFFGLLILILIPAAYLLYGGDQEKLVSKVNPASELKVEEDARDYEHISLNELYKQVKQEYPKYEIINVNTQNYGKEDALAFWNIDDHQGINSSGSLAMRMKDGVILEKYSTLPNDKGYNMSVIGYIFKLHFASFGGFTMRIIYFVLSMITCFMIISGVLIWRTARDNNKYTLKQRLFHHRVTKWYMAICLSMFPAFAIIFLANKLVPMEMIGRVNLVNQIFFLSWLGLTILGLFWNKYSQQNRNYLIIGGILSILIPIMNGFATNGWIWNMWNSYPWVAYVDLFWLSTGVVSLYLSFFILKVKETTDIPQPIEMKSGKTVPEQPERIMVPKPSLKRPSLKPELAINGLKDSISEN